MPTKLSIDIISDIICPWCLIGKRRLEIALQQLAIDNPEIKPVIHWKPYFLNPDMPLDGEPYKPYLEHKFGGKDEVTKFIALVTEAGKTIGINFNFDNIEVCPNTRLAHRLIHRIQQLDDANPLVERLISAHLQLGEKVGNIEVLVKIANEFGLEEDNTRAYLSSNEGTYTVDNEALSSQQMGVNILPFFVFNGRVAVGGAQEPDVLLKAIKKALELS